MSAPYFNAGLVALQSGLPDKFKYSWTFGNFLCIDYYTCDEIHPTLPVFRKLLSSCSRKK